MITRIIIVGLTIISLCEYFIKNDVKEASYTMLWVIAIMLAYIWAEIDNH